MLAYIVLAESGSHDEVETTVIHVSDNLETALSHNTTTRNHTLTLQKWVNNTLVEEAIKCDETSNLWSKKFDIIEDAEKAIQAKKEELAKEETSLMELKEFLTITK
jgi:hypothetical protein